MRRRTAVLLSATVCLAVCAPASAWAQWKWKDAGGHVHYSDMAPPAGTPERDVLQRPVGARAAVPQSAAGLASAATPASLAAPAPDAALYARKRKAAEDDAAQMAARLKADQDKLAVLRRASCDQARAQLRTLNDGMRITRINAQGEREFLDDTQRATERARAQEAIGTQCR